MLIRSTEQHGELPPLRPVPGWPGNYVSKCGRHFAHHNHHGIVNKYWEHTVGRVNEGYLTYNLVYRDGRSKARVRAHRVILTAWVEPPPFPDAVVDHIDRNRANNRITNIVWATQWQNQLNRGNDIRGYKIRKDCKTKPYEVAAYYHVRTKELLTPGKYFATPEEASAYYWHCKNTVWKPAADDDFDLQCKMHRATLGRGARMA